MKNPFQLANETVKNYFQDKEICLEKTTNTDRHQEGLKPSTNPSQEWHKVLDAHISSLGYAEDGHIGIIVTIEGKHDYLRIEIYQDDEVLVR